ncbi:hypothetical protein EVAR_4412_1 [Eumeta japonica]|uniref:Uncharacterized protein n=1 Tax=Eumeta variegata TaxID=151549 RepID=A0A4C1T0K3_EUMVA|nr:hypothetical protein EVAR_4412_1 [Eumeta japonica]
MSFKKKKNANVTSDLGVVSFYTQKTSKPPIRFLGSNFDRTLKRFFTSSPIPKIICYNGGKPEKNEQLPRAAAESCPRGGEIVVVLRSADRNATKTRRISSIVRVLPPPGLAAAWSLRTDGGPCTLYPLRWSDAAGRLLTGVIFDAMSSTAALTNPPNHGARGFI